MANYSDELYYEFSIDDMEDIIEQLDIICDELVEIGANKPELEENEGEYADQLGEDLEELKVNEHNLYNNIYNFKVKMEILVADVETEAQIKSQTAVFLYEPKELNKLINDVRDILDKDGEYRYIFKKTETFSDWEREAREVFDDPEGWQAGEMIDEASHLNREHAFRKNIDTMNELNETLNDMFRVKGFISNIETIKSKLDGVSVIFDNFKIIEDIINDNRHYGTPPTSTDTVNVVNVANADEKIKSDFKAVAEDIDNQISNFVSFLSNLLSGKSISDALNILNDLNMIVTIIATINYINGVGIPQENLTKLQDLIIAMIGRLEKIKLTDGEIIRSIEYDASTGQITINTYNINTSNGDTDPSYTINIDDVRHTQIDEIIYNAEQEDIEILSDLVNDLIDTIATLAYVPEVIVKVSMVLQDLADIFIAVEDMQSVNSEVNKMFFEYLDGARVGDSAYLNAITVIELYELKQSELLGGYTELKTRDDFLEWMEEPVEYKNIDGIEKINTREGAIEEIIGSLKLSLGVQK